MAKAQDIDSSVHHQLPPPPPPPPPPMDLDPNDIDQLLENYLGLLDEYTTLREALNSAQTRMYQNIARANFSAERGIRYGPDYYDERMQASRRLSIEIDTHDCASYELAKTTDDVSAKEKAGAAASCSEDEKQAEKPDEVKPEEKTAPRDPLRWFGILAPMPLRQAQAEAVKAVEEMIPRLVTVNAKMRNVEIQVRRARKRRAKAESAASKKSESTETTDFSSATGRSALPTMETQSQ